MTIGQRSTRGTTLRLGGILIAFVLFCTSHVQAAETVRTWTDATGRHKTEAAFVRLEGESVYLKLTSGRVISMTLSRLIEADRELVASLAKAEPSGPPADASSLALVREASVLVWRQHGERATPTTGIVVRKEGDRAFVLVPGGRTVSGPSFTREEVSFSIASGAGNAAPRVAAEWLAARSDGARSLLAAPAGQLPEPVPASSAIAPVEGDILTVFGFTVSRGSLPSASRCEQTATVHRVFRSLDNDVTNIRIDSSTPLPTLSLVADRNGAFVGVVTHSIRTSDRSYDRRTPPEPPRFHMIQPPDRFLARIDEPYQKSASFVRKGQQGDTTTYQFVVFVSDPFQQIRNPRLRIRPKKHFEEYEPPASADPHVLHTDLAPLKLSLQSPDKDLTGSLRNYAAHRHYTTLVADFETKLRARQDFDEFMGQLVYETPDGEAHYDVKLRISD